MTEVTFVGTSDAFGTGGRRQAAILVRHGGGAVLLDCGATTGTGLQALGIARDEIEAIVVSHFHADHFGGIPLLLLAAHYEDRRRKPLVVAGPPQVEARVRAAAAARGHAIEDREWSFPLRFVELQPGQEIGLGPVGFDAFAAHHQQDSQPHGLVVRAGPRTIIYTGDTGWFDELPDRTRGADLLISECTFFDFTFDYHLTYEKLLPRMGEFRCGRIVLTHLGRGMAERRGRLELETADDGMVVRV